MKIDGRKYRSISSAELLISISLEPDFETAKSLIHLVCWILFNAVLLFGKYGVMVPIIAGKKLYICIYIQRERGECESTKMMHD